MTQFVIRDGVRTQFHFIPCLMLWDSSEKESQYLTSKTVFIQRPIDLMQEFPLM